MERVQENDNQLKQNLRILSELEENELRVLEQLEQTQNQQMKQSEKLDYVYHHPMETIKKAEDSKRS